MSVKDYFIRDILKDEGRRFLKNQGLAIRRELKFHTYRLYLDRKAEVLSQSHNNTLRITVPHYNRILDIKRPVKNKKGTKVSRKSRRIYNRFVMGAYYSIAFRASNDFTKEVRNDIIAKYKGVLRHG